VTDIAGERARLAAQGLVITTREQWGAQQAYTSARTVNRPARWLFLHITVTADPADTVAAESAACRQVEAIGQARFGIGWSYNAGAMQSGRLYEGQPLTRRGAHTVNDKPNPSFPTGSLNYDARALAIVQNIQDAVTDAQIDSAARWGAALRRSGEAVGNARWYGHRDVTAKSCPGPIAYARLAELNALTDHYTNVGLKEDTLSAADVAAINAHTTAEANRVIAQVFDSRPFFAHDYSRDDDVLWVVYKDNGTKRWVPADTEEAGEALLADRVFSNGTWPNGFPKAWDRSKAHLDLYETVGPVPPGWEPAPVPPG
jgi:N-acetylmuramoyl-L-alanine amidase